MMFGMNGMKRGQSLSVGHVASMSDILLIQKEEYSMQAIASIISMIHLLSYIARSAVIMKKTKKIKVCYR